MKQKNIMSEVYNSLQSVNKLRYFTKGKLIGVISQFKILIKSILIINLVLQILIMCLVINVLKTCFLFSQKFQKIRFTNANDSKAPEKYIRFFLMKIYIQLDKNLLNCIYLSQNNIHNFHKYVQIRLGINLFLYVQFSNQKHSCTEV